MGARVRKIIRAILFSLPLLIVSCGIYAFFIEHNRLVLHQETIHIDNWPKELSGLRIALIGDLHTGGPFINEKKLREIVRLTNQQNPNLIVLLGDYMSPNSWHSHQVGPEVTTAILKDLHAPLGTYSVLGNHAWRYSGEPVRRALEANGIHVLDENVAEG